MGAWGEKAWENDEAADWFAKLMDRVDTRFILDEAEEKIKEPDNYDEVRAIAYVLGHFGKTYIWPIKEMDRVDRIKEKVSIYLKSLVAEDSEFMGMWDNDEQVKLELLKEIELLEI